MSNAPSNVTDQTAKDIGEIKGLLQGVTQMIAANNDALNRRIDDMNAGTLRRFDDLTRAVTQRLDTQESRLGRVEMTANEAQAAAKSNRTAIDGMQRHTTKTATGVGAVSATLVTGAFEIIKAVLRG